MASYRTVQIGYWSDPYIEQLPATGKLLYLYLITSCINNLGVLELTNHRIAFDTGLSEKEVSAQMERLCTDGKVVRDGSAILLVHFVSHQTSTSPKIIIGLRENFKAVTSKKLKVALVKAYPFLCDNPDTLSDGIDTLSDDADTPRGIEVELNKREEEGKGNCEAEEDEAIFGTADYMKLWNELMPPHGFSRASRITDSRRTHFKARQQTFPEAKTEEFWRKALFVVWNSDFLSGKNDRGWKADIDFPIASDDKLTRIVEGKYDNKRASPEVVEFGDEQF